MLMCVCLYLGSIRGAEHVNIQSYSPALTVALRSVLWTSVINWRHTPLNSVCRLGILTCYLDPVDLVSFLQDSAVSLALWQQLAQCMSKGFISDSGRVSTTSVNLLETTDILIIFSSLCSSTLCLTNWADLCVMDSCPLGWYQPFRRWMSAAWLLQTFLPSLVCYLS